MPFKKILLSLAILCSAISLRAAAQVNETPTQEKVDQSLIADGSDKTEPVIPKRKLKFDVSEEEESLPLLNVQEGMLDQRYVATFQLEIPKNEKYEKPTPGFQRRTNSDEMENLSHYESFLKNWIKYSSSKFGVVENQRIESFKRLPSQNPIPKPDILLLEKFESLQSCIFYTAASAFTPRGEIRIFTRPDAMFSNFESHMPKQHKPSRKISDVYTGKEPPFIRSGRPSDEKGKPSYVFKVEILAPSAEEAKQWTDAWLGYYDWGLCYPAQQECLQIITHLKDEVAKQQEAVKKFEIDSKTYEKQAEQYKEFDDIKLDTLPALITQRRILSIDLVGVKARIEACDKMLEDLKRNQERNTIANRQQPENARVAAEIELVGLTAKHKEIDRIIQGVQNRQENALNLSRARLEISQRRQAIENSQGFIPLIAQYQLGYHPLPVEDNKITIRRIKWTSPSKPEEPKK